MRHDVEAFFASRVTYPGQWHMLRTSANGQPAGAGYLRDADGVLAAHSLHVFTVTTSGIGRIVAFRDPALFASFGFPASLPG